MIKDVLQPNNLIFKISYTFFFFSKNLGLRKVEMCPVSFSRDIAASAAGRGELERDPEAACLSHGIRHLQCIKLRFVCCVPVNYSAC